MNSQTSKPPTQTAMQAQIEIFFATDGDSTEKLRTARCFCVKLRSTGLMQVPWGFHQREIWDFADFATKSESHGKFKVVDM